MKTSPLFILLAAVGFLNQPAQAQNLDPQIIGSIAHIDIMPQDLKKVVDAFKGYMATAPKERGALEIRMLQQIGSPNHFTLVEFWADQKAYDDHVAAKSTREFKKILAASLGSPYDERLHTEKLDFNH